MPKCDFNKVECNFIEITLQHGCSPVNLLHIFRTPFTKNISGWLLLCLLLPFTKNCFLTYDSYEFIKAGMSTS